MSVSAQQLLGFEGRAAIIWGGGAGIGASTSRLLSDLGAKVAVVDRDLAVAEGVAAELREAGRNVLALQCDVRDAASVDAAVSETVATLGLPTLSASVVGVAAWADLLDMTVDAWDDQLALNLRPMFLIGRSVARVLRDAGQGGALAFVGSVSGAQAAVRHAPYGCAKAGMVSLAKTMAAEWGPLGIRVNCLAPGPVATARITRTPEMDGLLARRLPLGRFGTVDEIASGLTLLLSDMAPFTTGETLYVDGGWMAAPTVSPNENPKI